MAERWSVGLIGAIGAAAGGVSAAAASLLGGGQAFVGGTAVGVASGAIVAGALFWAVRDQAEPGPAAPRQPVRPEGFAPLGEPGQPVGEPVGSDTTNLTPLVRAVGARFAELAELQLDAVQAVGRTVRGPAPEELFAAERLARRTRRAAATLAVLADPEPDLEPVPEPGPDFGSGPGQDRCIAAVLDDALADSEHRARVDRGSVQDVTVSGRAAEDVAHLLAELIDNAAEVSDETVTIVGRRNADGYVLSVVDEGGGLSATAREDANRTLTSPPGLDRQGPAGLGLSAVGRLAARHGIGVQLLEGATDGIIAKVRLPARLLDAGAVAITTPHGGDHSGPDPDDDLYDDDGVEDHDPELDATAELGDVTSPHVIELSDPQRPTPSPVVAGDRWPEALAASIAEADGPEDGTDTDPDTDLAAGPAGPADTVHASHTGGDEATPLPGPPAPAGRRHR